ncbi:hypothetical protein ACFSSB_15465 [Lacinutrix gracilariae]|uniref:Uncharacterized protein n=1 Tax=Lacinutrix gracilariae TaxID=1747198 RepID=A0ABW5K6G5_9FLAO
MDLKNENFDFTKIIPIGAVFITLCSSIHYIFYYNFFNIRIINYLTITEYASLFLEHILAYLIIIFGGFIFSFLSNNWPKKSGKGSVIFGMSIVIIYTLVRLFFFSEKINERINEVTFIIFYIIFLVFYLRRLKNKNLNVLVYLAIISIVYSVSSGFVSAYKVIENESKLKYEFKFEENTISSSEKKYYLGRSENYLFFYNNTSKVSEVIKTNNLKSINILEKNN